MKVQIFMISNLEPNKEFSFIMYNNPTRLMIRKYLLIDKLKLFNIVIRMNFEHGDLKILSPTNAT